LIKICEFTVCSWMSILTLIFTKSAWIISLSLLLAYRYRYKDRNIISGLIFRDKRYKDTTTAKVKFPIVIDATDRRFGSYIDFVLLLSNWNDLIFFSYSNFLVFCMFFLNWSHRMRVKIFMDYFFCFGCNKSPKKNCCDKRNKKALNNLSNDRSLSITLHQQTWTAIQMAIITMAISIKLKTTIWMWSKFCLLHQSDHLFVNNRESKTTARAKAMKRLDFYKNKTIFPSENW